VWKYPDTRGGVGPDRVEEGKAWRVSTIALKKIRPRMKVSVHLLPPTHSSAAMEGKKKKKDVRLHQQLK
jgi:hypothetical protein